MFLTLIILAATAVLFATGKIRSDVVAVCALILLTTLGILTPDEALAGFSNQVVIMMVGLFVVGGAIFQTGLAKMISGRIMKLAGGSALRLFLLVMIVTSAIGAFVTGSGTNTEVLLGGLQAEAASAIEVSQYWLAAANSTGAGIGKILSPQCIATAVAAVSMTGQDSVLLKGIFKWAMLLLVIACLVVGLLVGISPA